MQPHFTMAILHSITQYLEALESAPLYMRTLSDLIPCRRADGALSYSVGNSAVLFRVEYHGEIYSLKCYLKRSSADLEAIYGDCFRREEIFLSKGTGGGEWVDALLLPYVEGRSLDVVIEEFAMSGDRDSLIKLSRGFDDLAREMVTDDWAHGDLKPENIIVTENLELQLIDFDAAFKPGLSGRYSPELGTPAFRHPQRRKEDFDRWLDHYSAALISVQLRALALDPTLLDMECIGDGILFAGEEIFGFNRLTDDDIDSEQYYRLKGRFLKIEELFKLHLQPRHYRLMRLLYDAPLRSQPIERMMSFRDAEWCPEPEFFMEWGLCGYLSGDETAIPPLFDEAFDFVDGAAVVRLGEYWHVIDRACCSLWVRGGCVAVKLLDRGRVSWYDGSEWHAEQIK